MELVGKEFSLHRVYIYRWMRGWMDLHGQNRTEDEIECMYYDFIYIGLYSVYMIGVLILQWIQS